MKCSFLSPESWLQVESSTNESRAAAWQTTPWVKHSWVWETSFQPNWEKKKKCRSFFLSSPLLTLSLSSPFMPFLHLSGSQALGVGGGGGVVSIWKRIKPLNQLKNLKQQIQNEKCLIHTMPENKTQTPRPPPRQFSLQASQSLCETSNTGQEYSVTQDQN